MPLRGHWISSLLAFVAACGGMAERTDDGAQSAGGNANRGGEGATEAGLGGGQSGASGAGAQSGTGGNSEPECFADTDCRRVDTCCDCLAEPVAQTPPACEADSCVTTACGAKGMGVWAAAMCDNGRCVLKTICDASLVQCHAAMPTCAAGEAAAIEGECWTGACVPVTQCAMVTDCSVCGPNTGCVVGNILGRKFYGCATPPSECPEDRSCACFGKSVCGAFACTERSDGVACVCYNC